METPPFTECWVPSSPLQYPGISLSGVFSKGQLRWIVFNWKGYLYKWFVSFPGFYFPECHCNNFENIINLHRIQSVPTCLWVFVRSIFSDNLASRPFSPRCTRRPAAAFPNSGSFTETDPSRAVVHARQPEGRFLNILSQL